jgi:hypothetical protein
LHQGWFLLFDYHLLTWRFLTGHNARRNMKPKCISTRIIYLWCNHCVMQCLVLSVTTINTLLWTFLLYVPSNEQGNDHCSEVFFEQFCAIIVC